jgi:glycosyltransferase involved in cell wall biosynthesis
MTFSGRDIVCVGLADWETDLWTNQHHLMSRLARTNRVLFVESLGLRRPQIAGRDLRRIGRRLRAGLAPPRERDGLHVLSPLVLPFHGNAAVRRLNARLLPALVGRAADRLGFRNPILWSYVPQAEVLLEPLAPSTVVYHCVDDIASQKGVDAASFRAAEQRFLRRTDLVLASAPLLAERARSVATNVLDAPNVADTALFSTALDDGPVDPAIAALPAPRIVFTGAVVTTKLDIPLIVELARSSPDSSIALVGPVGVGDPTTDVSALEREPNVHLLGGRRYGELPAVLRGADAAIIPYARTPLTDGVFPMKVYEYLAAGLPVVTTPLPSLQGVEEVEFARTGREFAERIAALIAADSPAARAERSARAATHSWDARIAQIAAAFDDLAPSRS